MSALPNEPVTEPTPAVVIRDLIRSVAKRRRRAQPNEIARLVAEKTPQHMLFDCYVDVLQDRVADQMRRDRNDMLNSIRKARETAGAGPRGPRPVSANVAAIRAINWDDFFLQRIHTSDGWKQIGDCSADDLKYYATGLRSHAENTILHAEFYEDLAQRIRKAKVATARDLPAKDRPQL